MEWGAGVGGEDTIYQNESDKGLFDQSTRPPGAAIRSGHLARPPGPATRPRPATRPSPATRPGPARAGYPARLSILAMGLATRPSWPGHPAQQHVPADRPCHSARAGHPAPPGPARPGPAWPPGDSGHLRPRGLQAPHAPGEGLKCRESLESLVFSFTF